jgi:hypothetical protein
MPTLPAQQALFVDTIYEALKGAVVALGGLKRVGPRLFPHLALKDPNEAGRYLADCLSRSRRAKLDLEQMLLILRWARDAGYHDAKHWIDDACGYLPTPAADPAEQENEQVRVLRDAAAIMAGAMEKLERLQGSKLKAVRR